MTGPELIERIDPLLWRLAGRAARRFGEDSADWLQELRLDVLRFAHSYDPERGAPTTWVFQRYRKVVSHRMAAASAAMRARPNGVYDASDPLNDRIDHRAEDPAEHAERIEAEQQLKKAISRLPKRERVLMEGRLAGISFRDLAKVLGVTHQRTHQLNQRAKQRLRQVVGAVADC